VLSTTCSRSSLGGDVRLCGSLTGGRIQIVGAVSALALFLLCYCLFGASLTDGGGLDSRSSSYGTSAVSTFHPARINVAKVRPRSARRRETRA
jgi:hypothetical protein